jgi:Domain of Unknown Function (DUF1080)
MRIQGFGIFSLFIGAALAASAFLCDAAAAKHVVAVKHWQALFDGTTTDAFRGYHSESLPEGWHVLDGVLTKEGSVDELVTRKQYANFVLELEWKIGKEGNSGVFYRATREYDYIYWSGPEYQLLDDANAPDGKSRLTAAASAYGLYGAPAGVVKPFGEWNKTRIVVQGAHVEHWLNGQKVVAYDLGSQEWKAKVAASKFSKFPNYGTASTGFIGIQGDHPGSLALRHIRIRELP